MVAAHHSLGYAHLESRPPLKASNAATKVTKGGIHASITSQAQRIPDCCADLAVQQRIPPALCVLIENAVNLIYSISRDGDYFRLDDFGA